MIGFLCSNPSLRENITHRACDGFKTLAGADLSRLQNVIKYEVAFVEGILRPSELNRATPVSFYDLIKPRRICLFWFRRCPGFSHGVTCFSDRYCIHMDLITLQTLSPSVEVVPSADA